MAIRPRQKQRAKRRVESAKQRTARLQKIINGSARSNINRSKKGK